MGARAIKGGKYTLYGRPGSGSAAVEAMLELTGVNHQTIDVGKADAEALAKLRALNPLCQVPTLVLPSGEIMTESAAMLVFLADLAPKSGLAPGVDDPRRAKFLRLMVYLSANLYMSFLRFYYSDRYIADPAGADAVTRAAAEQIGFEWRVFDDLIAPGPFALGEAMSGVDIYAAMLMDWTDDRDALFARHPRLAAIARAVAAHPKIGPAWSRHGIVPPSA
ncbi:MAG: glutathione S-transferase family protein [Phyllobacteriaceae bacterium]|nr:glutathione S-transferase family protein [Phyllobacteriaceae bacterium]